MQYNNTFHFIYENTTTKQKKMHFIPFGIRSFATTQNKSLKKIYEITIYTDNTDIHILRVFKILK